MAKQTKIDLAHASFIVDDDRKLRRQMQRKKRRALYRQITEDKLLDRAYQGYTEEQKREDLQLRIQLDWLCNQL